MAVTLAAYGTVLGISTAVLVVYMTWLYSRPGTPIPAMILTAMAWWFAFSVCFLVPIDLVPAAQGTMDFAWNTVFWGSFLLMWIILPLVSGYYDNGEFTFRRRLIASLKFNGILFGGAGLILGIGIIYFLASHKLTASQLMVRLPPPKLALTLIRCVCVAVLAALRLECVGFDHARVLARLWFDRIPSASPVCYSADATSTLLVLSSIEPIP